MSLLKEQLELCGLELSPGKPVQLEVTRDGLFTLKHGGKYLHSKYSPAKEAERMVAEIPRENDSQLIVFFGGGLGYAVSLYLDRFPNPMLWIEPDMELLQAALNITDFREHLRTGHLSIFAGTPTEDDLDRLFKEKRNEQTVFAWHRATFEPGSAYVLSKELCERHLNRKDVNFATLTKFEKVWSKNLISNLPVIARARPVSRLFNLFPDTPTLVCGAGPSLSRSIPELKKIRNDCLLIAVDTALRVLTAHGIDPDIIMSVDPQALNSYYLEGYEGRGIFVVDPTTSYLSLRHIEPNRIFYTDSPFPLAKHFYSLMGEEPGTIAFGGSVSTNAYDLAQKLGAKEVFLFGQDLSFTGKQAHARGAVLEERLNLKENRLFRRELHNYRQLSALPVRYLPAIGGGETQTNDKLIIFHRWFSERAPRDIQFGVAVQNCSAAGAYLEGVPHGPAQPRGPAPDLSSLQMLEKKPAAEPEQFRNDLLKLHSSLVEFEELIVQGKNLAEKIIKRVREGRLDDTYGKLLIRMDALDTRVASHMEITQIVGNAMQRVIFQITEDYGNLMSEEEKNNPDLNVARKSELFYNGLYEACTSQARWLRKSIAILEIDKTD